MKKLSELDAIKYTLKALTRVQTREDKRHIMDAHLNSEMREYLEEAIELLERIDNYDPTPIDTSYREFDERKKKRLKEEPWVNVLELGVDPENAKAGYIELDWNDHFVKMLHNNGYTGQSDEDVVNKQFNDVCKTVLLQERADLDYGLQEQKEMSLDVEADTGDQDERETGETSKDD